MINTVVFDLGAVLVDWNPRYVFKHLFVTEDATEHFLAKVCTSEWNELQDAGRSFQEATNILTEQFPEYRSEIAAYYGRWEEMLKGPIPETVVLLAELKASNSFKLFALTNWSAESFPVAKEKYNFLSWFDGIVVSGEEKMKKPDPAIFYLLLERYSIDVKSCLFIDDNLLNIETASQLGIQCVHFEETNFSVSKIRHLLMGN
jgi:2-haloacid dehalogenase